MPGSGPTRTPSTARPSFADLLAAHGAAFDRGELAGAERLARRALRVAREASERSIAETSLGTLLRIRGRHAEAERHLRAAIRLSRGNAVMVAGAKNALGMLYKYTGNWVAGMRLYREALAIYERRFGRDDPRLASVLHNLGGTEHARGRFARGERYARRGLAIRIKAFGRDDVLVARDEAALGALLEGKGELGEAGRLYRRALRVFEARRQQLEVAVTCNNLGSLAYARGDVRGAIRYARRALRIKERIFGRQHPDVAVTLNNLAVFSESRAYAQRALAILVRVYGPRHHLTHECRANLAML